MQYSKLKNCILERKKLLLLPAWLSIWPEENPNEKITRLFNQALRETQLGYYETSKKTYHLILKELNNMKQEALLTDRLYAEKKSRVYCEMANLELYDGNHDKAEKLLIETMKEAIIAGVDQTEPMIVEMSLKLAMIYSSAKKSDLAETGFEFCIDTLEKTMNVDSDSTQNNAALLGMSHNYYAKFLYEQRRVEAALLHTLKALNICSEVYSPEHDNCINLMLDKALVESEFDIDNARLTSHNAETTIKKRLMETDIKEQSSVYLHLYNCVLQRAEFEATHGFINEAKKYLHLARIYQAKLKKDGSSNSKSIHEIEEHLKNMKIKHANNFNKREEVP